MGANRLESRRLLDENLLVSARIDGYAQAKRSRESETMLRSRCVMYTLVVTATPAAAATAAADLYVAETSDTADSSRDRTWTVFRRYKDFERLDTSLRTSVRPCIVALPQMKS